ncbi:uncharacterized protein LOC109846029 [Asparagus officinalis]|uniref:uncharacterized protein LOC109846029 n=1 Tax=Asparagus officinalis TaxID=4686 RepID=UPI00098E7E3D|nr:uncharacterized protein LOC109846029 [Asparagus officinalis]
MMSFGFKNVGATYQRLVNKVFKHQIGHNLEAYVDDLLVDGSSGEAGSGGGIVLRSPDGSTHEHSIAFSFLASNNKAEYKALLVGLRAFQAVKAERLYILAKSHLVVHQVNRQYAAKDPRMVLYLKATNEILASFMDFKIAQVPRAPNTQVDALSKL